MGKIEERFKKAGVKIKKLESMEEIKNNNWVMPNGDKEGMIRLKTIDLINVIKVLIGK